MPFKLVNKAPGGQPSNATTQQAAPVQAPPKQPTNAPAQQPAPDRVPAKGPTYANMIANARGPAPPPSVNNRGAQGPGGNNLAQRVAAMNINGAGAQGMVGRQPGGPGSVAGPRGHPVAPQAAQPHPGAPNTPAVAAQQAAAQAPTGAGFGNILPSIAPAPTLISKLNYAPSHAGSIVNQGKLPNKLHHAAVVANFYDNGLCRMAPHKRFHFQSGDVIAAPYHTPQMNPCLASNSPDWVMSAQGPVFSKRRMGIVLWKSIDTMIVLPLFSWTGQGIGSRAFKGMNKYDEKNAIQDYVEVFNYKDRKTFQMKGVHEPLHFVHKDSWRDLNEHTTCHITGAVMVKWQEDITQVGRLTRSSFDRLMELRQRREAYYIDENEESNEWPNEGERDTRTLKKQPKPPRAPQQPQQTGLLLPTT